ncbi:MAG TPA: hypothetical protein VL241_09865 [Gemmatimonadales bacterium]|nr:hypothetical protein [Gemmatimonadales bacterium]
MSYRSMGSWALLAAGLFAAACQEGSPTAPTEASLEVQAALGQAGDAAALSGDVEQAEAFRHGAEALRWGIRPSQIEVKIKNESFTYLAIVVGVQRRGGQGEPVLVRTLVAWTGRPPTALLHVISKSDQALFDPGGDVAGARGQWKNLLAHELWVATAGSADMELVNTGNLCAVQPANGKHCWLASYDVRINGNFQLQGSGGPDGSPIEIHTNSDGVHGIVLKP